MNIIIKRRYFCKEYIIGDVYLNNESTPVCNSLEPSLSAAHPAIPAGSYPIELRYSHKFKRYMPFLAGVPCRTGIMLHPGNTSKDTLGCILLGRNTVKGAVTDSRNTFNSVFDAFSQDLFTTKDICLCVIKNK
jgi:hypothetical protein